MEELTNLAENLMVKTKAFTDGIIDFFTTKKSLKSVDGAGPIG